VLPFGAVRRARRTTWWCTGEEGGRQRAAVDAADRQLPAGDAAGIELDATWPEERRRALVANALELGRWRGTVLGLAMLVELYTGGPAEIVDGGAVVASEDPTEPLPGGAVTTVTVRYTPGPDVDGRRLERLVRDFVPAHLAVRCEAAAS
jgi:hypothetical protein